MTLEDWAAIVRMGSYWRWVGDGVYAELTVTNTPGSDHKDSYRMSLEFELLDVRLKRFSEALAKELKEGDAKGWNSTAEHDANHRKAMARNERLKVNAVKRGDSVVVTPSP